MDHSGPVHRDLGLNAAVGNADEIDAFIISGTTERRGGRETEHRCQRERQDRAHPGDDTAAWRITGGPRG